MFIISSSSIVHFRLRQNNYAYHIILLQNEIQTKYIIKTYIFHLHKMVKRSNFI